MAKIITLRNQQVILDSDMAELYGVKTKEINQAVSNGPNKFPNGYIFQLDNQEITALRSKNLTLKDAGRGQHSKYPPKAFTEKGLYMLATILKSPKAVETTIAIVEAYAKLKELSRVIVEVPQHEDKSTEQQVLLHCGGQLIEEIMSDILPKQSRETSFELNLAMFKFKHSVKRENDDEIVSFPKNGPNNGSSTGSETETVEAPTINGATPFEETTQVSISGPAGAEIRYTTDGSTPTAESTLYSEAFTLSDTTTVKAIAVKNGTSSSVTTQTFTKGSGNSGLGGEE